MGLFHWWGSPIFLFLIANNYLSAQHVFGTLLTHLFLNIFTALEIEKTDENCKHRSRYVENCIKAEFIVVFDHLRHYFLLLLKLSLIYEIKTQITIWICLLICCFFHHRQNLHHLWYLFSIFTPKRSNKFFWNIFIAVFKIFMT